MAKREFAAMKRDLLYMLYEAGFCYEAGMKESRLAVLNVALSRGNAA